MNKNYILLLLFVVFAGCSGTQEVVESENNSDNSVLDTENVNKVDEVVETTEKEEIASETPLETKEPVKKEIREEIKKEDKSDESTETKVNIDIYKYPFDVNGKKFNVQFYNTLDEIEEMDFKIGISKEEFFDTETFDFVFSSKPSSNGAVVKVSGRLFVLMSIGFKFPLDALEDLVRSDEVTCEDSTLSNKLILFDSDYTSNEVLYNSENGCIEFKTTSQDLMGDLGDKFLIHILN